MTTFSESALEKKLGELNNSQQSIQTLSLWLIHHRKHCKNIVQVWLKELLKVKTGRKLTFMYLANDVIQNSKKKGPEFTKEFGSVLTRAFEYVSVDADEKTLKGSLRLLQIWQERMVYDSATIEEFKTAIETGKSPIRKKVKIESPVIIQTKEIESPPKSPPRDPPDPDELIQALQDLENSASSDAAVREKIASLPAEVSDVSLLEGIQDRSAAEKLSAQVDEACTLLDEYNGRLTAELEERKHVARMLSDFIHAQKEAFQQAQAKLNEFQTKLHKVNQIRNELKSHIQNLPDLTLLPDVTGGLAPLPSVGDLFSLGDGHH